VREKYIVLVGSLLVFFSMVNAGDLERGIQFFERHQYDKAKVLWQPLAEQGDIRAQYNLILLLSNHSKLKNNTEKKQQQIDYYLALSRSAGLIDSYFISFKQKILKSSLESELDWLSKQQKNHYTLQLATGKNRISMEIMQTKLITAHQLKQIADLHIHKIIKKGTQSLVTRYILIYGVFKNYQDAQEAIKKLPQSLQQSAPWIRQFRVLQAKIK
jgi:hypothetical protein